MTQPLWTFLHPQMIYAHLGILPSFLNEDDPRSAVEQIDAAYAHGGGWHSFRGFKAKSGYRIQYPGDPVYMPLALCRLREETIVFYNHSWVGVWKDDNLVDIARID